MTADPDFPKKLLSGEIEGAPQDKPSSVLIDTLSWSNIQIERMADGHEPDLTLVPAQATEQFFAIESGNTAALLEHRRAR